MIRISAWDKFRVETVSVMILNNKGQLIEKGPAASRMFSGNREWNYVATVENVDYQGGSVEIRVTDKPGNVVKRSLLLIVHRGIVTPITPPPTPPPRGRGAMGGKIPS